MRTLVFTGHRYGEDSFLPLPGSFLSLDMPRTCHYQFGSFQFPNNMRQDQEALSQSNFYDAGNASCDCYETEKKKHRETEDRVV